MKLRWILLALTASGCATTGASAPRWEPQHADTEALLRAYPRADAVLLLRDTRYAISGDTGGHTQQSFHNVIAILSDGGKRFAEVSIPAQRNMRIAYLRARTLGADGVSHEVSLEEVHVAASHVSAIDEAFGYRDERMQVFRFPAVTVGSIIEYAYELESDTLPLEISGRMRQPLPTLHYHLEISTTGPIELGFRLYNGQAPIKQTVEGSTRRAILDLDNVRAYLEEPLAPPMHATEPWWDLTMKREFTRHGPVLAFDSWPHTVGSVLASIDQRGLYDGVDLTPDLAGCQRGHRCAVDRALDFVNRKTMLTGFVSWFGNVRKMKEVLASHEANNYEKALLLYGALRSTGVRSRLALVARQRNFDFDPQFPSPNKFDHMIVYVDGLADQPEGLFIDPSCESCAAGEIPSWTRDRQAMAIEKGRAYFSGSQPDALVEILHTPAEERGSAENHTGIDAKLDANGALAGRLTRTLRGYLAVDEFVHTRGWLDSQWQTELDKLLHHYAKAAELRAKTRASYDRNEPRFDVGLDFAAPGYAATSAGQLVVPLSFLFASYDDQVSDEPRRYPMWITASDRASETLTVRLPAGYRIAELPKSFTLHTAALDGAVSIGATGDTVIVKRLVQWRAGHWTPGDYTEMRDALRRLASVRETAFVLQKAP